MINRKKEPSSELTKTMEEELQDLYRYAFYRLGDEQDAEDIIQDLYISIHEKHDAASNIGNLRNYIYRALSNNCTLLLRKRANCKTVSIENIEDINLWESEPKNLEEEFTLINMLLDSIPHEQSEVIRLHIHGEKTFKDIGDILQIPEASVKSRYRYGIEKLRREIKNNH